MIVLNYLEVDVVKIFFLIVLTKKGVEFRVVEDARREGFMGGPEKLIEYRIVMNNKSSE